MGERGTVFTSLVLRRSRLGRLDFSLSLRRQRGRLPFPRLRTGQWGKRERLGSWVFTAYLDWVTYGIVNFWRDVHKPLVLRTHYFYLPYIWVPSIHVKQNTLLFKYMYIIFAITARIKWPMMASFVYKRAVVTLAYTLKKKPWFFLVQSSLYFCVGQERESGQIKVLERAQGWKRRVKMERKAKNPCLHAKISRRRFALKKPILWNKPTAKLSSAFYASSSSVL